MSDHIQVLTTTDSEEEAQAIAAVLVERRLAACVQVLGPVASTYRWHGEIERAQEWQCLAKTGAPLYPEVEAAIREAHSYDEPEIVAIPILRGSPGYLAWIDRNSGAT
jgi:periplasmic divalent cation tolerance protein